MIYTPIAPTIAQSGPDAFFEPWKDQATAIGQAVFKADDMAKLIAGVDEKFAGVGKNNPQFAGKKVLLRACTTCHDLDEVTKFKGYYTRAQWKDIVVTMKEYGASLDDAEADVLADYLVAVLGRR